MLSSIPAEDAQEAGSRSGNLLRMKAIQPTFGQVITAQAAIKPGVYPLGGDKAGPALTITLSDSYLDLSGVALIGVHHEPHRFKGVGILLKGCKGLRLSGVTVLRYHRGIVLEDCEEVTLVDCHADHNGCHRFYSTEEKYDKRDFLDIFDYKVWSKYGAGIYLSKCKRCTIHRTSACNQLNGIILDQCDECLVQGCECTDNLGWGVRLYRSSYNRIIGNDLSHCISGETPYYSVGNDSTGICICHACHFNVIADNDLQYGGDGFFLTADLGTEQSNDNLIIGNDGSYSPHNAFESTFCLRNRFYGNTASHSGYGFWMGFSCDNHVVDNEILGNRRAGIAIEHAEDNLIAGNEIGYNREQGVLLMRRRKEGPPSRRYRIEANHFEWNGVGVELSESTEITLYRNTFLGTGKPWTEDKGCKRNQFRENDVR